MRFEPNINMIIERGGQTYKTPIVEIKNLNSFKALYGSITYEQQRQLDAWMDTGEVMGDRAKTTRGWDDDRNVTILQRHKEDADEYRYFPDPDLVPVVVDEPWLERLRAEIPELPLQRLQRYVDDLGIDIKHARAITDERDVCLFYESIIEAGADAKRAAAVLMNNLSKRANEAECLVSDLGITAGQIVAIDRMQSDNQISSSGADDLIGLCCEDPAADPAQLAESKGLLQVSDDSALDEWCAAAIESEPQAADDVRAGNMKAIGRLVGAVMKLSKGQANPKIVTNKLREKLSG
ncbi:MAG: hypothetical protein CMJ49_14120 [Planctomycetaceae bacterium]|nr:hypothetical protein [Planctomycetaceae bacterium]